MRGSPKICVRHTSSSTSQKSGGAVGPSDCGTRPGGELLMAGVTELATEVGTRAACRALLRRALPIIAKGVRRSTLRRAGRGLHRHALLVRRNAKRSWHICTENASRIVRQPLFMRRCLMKESTSVQSAPWIAYSNGGASPANAAISSPIRPTRRRNFWPRLPINSGAGTSPNCWGPAKVDLLLSLRDP